jgi:hypothetical protein
LETAGGDIQKTGAAADDTLDKYTGQLTGTATGITQYFGNLTYDIIPRIVAGLAGI